jgi:hypothetical protein
VLDATVEDLVMLEARAVTRIPRRRHVEHVDVVRVDRSQARVILFVRQQVLARESEVVGAPSIQPGYRSVATVETSGSGS